MLPIISEEQQLIVDAISINNVVVDSVAGSGKTTTILHMAKKYPDKKLLMITYNAHLKLETCQRAKLLEIYNIDIYTYHSFAYNYISHSCWKDSGLFKHIDDPFDIDLYDIIVIDECQDMTLLYYKLIIRILNKLPDANICIIGDQYQSIYNYMGADSRFIKFADMIFPRKCEWSHLKLRTSYRLTDQIADFINKCVVGHDMIKTVRRGVLPVYNYISFGDTISLLTDINKLLKDGYSYDDIFILAPSVKSSNPLNPIKKIANIFSNNNIPIYVPIHNESKLNEKIIKGKIVFASYHQSKGLERRAVILLNFDQSYFKYYAKNVSPDRCPNVLYVALTRAKEYLSIYHINNNKSMNFLNTSILSEYASINGAANYKEDPNPYKIFQYGVTALLRNLSSQLLISCKKNMEIIKRSTSDTVLNTVSIIKNNDTLLYEEVSDINGVAIVSYYELIRTGKMTIGTYSELYNRSNIKNITPAEILQIANQFISTTSNLIYKVKQIGEYGWMNQDKLDMAYNRLFKILPDNCEFEKPITVSLGQYDLHGIIDVLSDNTIFEIKCVKQIKTEHLLQLAFYAYMWNIKYKNIPICYLYNVITDSLYQLIYDRDKIKNIILTIIESKYAEENNLSDEDFLINIDKLLKTPHRIN